MYCGGSVLAGIELSLIYASVPSNVNLIYTEPVRRRRRGSGDSGGRE
ncbi:hypothetical protein SMSP1_02093 [Sedimentisphaera salicampi]|nr:hypothetical protein SMSP1_02093 [Sedimentisphaera salicampi]